MSNTNKWSSIDNLQYSSSNEMSQKSSRNTSSKTILIPHKSIQDSFQILQCSDEQLTLQQQKNSIEVDNSKVYDSNEWKIVEQELSGKAFLFDKLLNDGCEKMKQMNIHSDCSNSFYSELENHDNSSFTTSSNDTKTDSTMSKVNNEIINKQRLEEIKKLRNFESPNQLHVKKRKKAKNSYNRKSQKKLKNINLFDKLFNLGYTKFVKFLNNTNREQQLRDVYTPQIILKPIVKSSNIYSMSYFVNRQKKYKEINRANQIIVSKILNVQTTIPQK